jgi:hypothetical protein
MQAKTRFLLKFLLLISVLLPLWLIGAAPQYLVVLAQESALVLRVLGYAILDVGTTPTHLSLQVSGDQWVEFEAILATLNTMVYVALVLSSVGVPWRRRLGFLLAGLLILNLFQVLYVVVHFYVNYHYEPNSSVTQAVNSASEVLYLLLPMLLWAVFEAPRLFASRRRRPAPGAIGAGAPVAEAGVGVEPAAEGGRDPAQAADAGRGIVPASE